MCQVNVERWDGSRKFLRMAFHGIRSRSLLTVDTSALNVELGHPTNSVRSLEEIGKH